MNFFDTSLRRRILFGSLYFSEGAPIGFLWLALPTRLRIAGVPIEQITWLTAILVLPWTFKFGWAPLVDLLRGRWWTLRHWIVAAQCVMGATLVPLMWLDPVPQFDLMAGLLLIHAFAAATQDVAIDALCISATLPSERGRYNGWMQTGMMLGRASMGGGALVLAAHLGYAAVVGLLVLATTFSMVLVLMSPPPRESEASTQRRWTEVGAAVHVALRQRSTWMGLLFALIGGASFKSLEVIYGPFLIDRGFDQEWIGWFSLGPMIGAMILGALVGGAVADRVGHRRCVAISLAMIAVATAGLALTDWLGQSTSSPWLPVGLVITALGIGFFTASSYALFMDISQRSIAATQFSAFMGATNGCESWSAYVSGRLIASSGYSTSMLTMSLVSLAAIPLIALLRRPPTVSSVE